MHSITVKQNEQRQVELLAAQRQLYSEAKRLQLFNFVLSVPCVVFLAFITLAFPATKSFAIIWSLAIAIGDVALLSIRQEELKTRAARIQELFDCAVLDLPCRELKGTSKVLPEEISRAAARYFRRNTDTSDLQNWYPVSVASLPLSLARLVCQRANFWWDSDVRQRYAGNILIGLLILSFIVVLIGMFRNSTLAELLLSVLSPLVPMWLWGLRQTRDQSKTAKKLDELRQQTEKSWNQALSYADTKTLDEQANKLREFAREIQDEIFEHRRSNQPIFDWIHKRLRSEMEAEMNKSAEFYVKQAQNRIQNA